MIVRKIKSSIVAHISYFIGSGVEVLVVDPRRDCMIYLVTFEANPVVNARINNSSVYRTLRI